MEFNHKLKINQESFVSRGLSIASIGFTELYKNWSEIRGRLKINLSYSDDLDYHGTYMRLVVTAKDSESFILGQDDTSSSPHGLELNLTASAINEAEIIEVSVTGNIPNRKAIIDPALSQVIVDNIEFDIDYGSFEKFGFMLKSFGFRQETTTAKRYKSMVMVEIENIQKRTFEKHQMIRLNASLYYGNKLIEIGTTDVVDFCGYFHSLSKITFGTTHDLINVTNIKLFITNMVGNDT